MKEKETAKPVRKRKSSGTEEKPVAEKTVRKSKNTAETVEAKSAKQKKTKDFVINAESGELKPVKKKASRKKLDASVEESATVSQTEIFASPELSAVAGSELAEAVQVIEETTEDLSRPKIKAPPSRKKAATGKAKNEAVSSDASIKKAAAKKTVSGAKKAKVKTTSEDSDSSEIKSIPAISEETTATATTTISSEDKSAASENKEQIVFETLAEPKLPALQQENRARLQIQSPFRIFFYWSIKNNPFETLYRAFPANRAGDYRLAIKLINLNNQTEETHSVEATGSWWFDAKPNTAYRAEVGFSAAHRPFIRLMYSNTVETPRSEPSPNRDWSMDFTISANQFAEVLDVAGYAHDAFEVAITGDDRDVSDAATQRAFTSLGGQSIEEDLNELRYALFALASGATLESLRGQISEKIYALLEAIIRQNAGQLSAEKIRSALRENFDFEDEQEDFSTPVFGASLINFPRKPRLPKLSPISSSK